jgi:iron complex outermembrane recepter protein
MNAKRPLSLVAALAALLGLLGPAWAQTPPGRLTGSVRDESGAGLPGARVAITDAQGTTTAATTDSSGAYALPDLKPGRYVVQVSLQGFSTVTRREVSVAGGSSQALDITLKVASLSEEITVTGTRVEGRSAIDTPAPVDYISQEMIQNTGATETGKILQLVEPSFNFSSTTISDGTDIIRPATLRSLGPDQVLVLVNGKRYHQQSLVHYQQTVGRGSAGYDINSIPASSIDHIEVLRDGASAQYGSDAISGVINVILKKNTKATDLMLEAGQHYAENPELPLNATPDAEGGRGARFSGSVNHGFDVGQDGFLNVTAEFRQRGETNRAGPDSIRVSPPRITQRIGDAESRDFLLWLNSELPTDNGSFYAFGGYSYRKGNSSGFFRTAGDDRTVPAVYPNGFLPTIITQPTDVQASLGYRAKLGSDWRWDASGSYGKSRFQFREENTVNVSYFFEPRDPANPTGPRFGESPVAADTGALAHDQLALNLDLSGVVNWGVGAGPLHLAVGSEWRQEGYEIEPGEEVSYEYGRNNDLGVRILGQNGQLAPPGTQGFPGYSPREAVDESRNNFALYADAESQLHRKFLVGLATRFERYADFGSTVTGKLSARFNATDKFALRGTLSNGFRAPGVQQLFYSSYSINLSGGVLVDTLTARQDSDVTEAFGIPPLQEETSINYSLGFVARPADNFRLTVDAYRIDIDDRIVFSANTAPEPRASCGVPVSESRCPIRGILNRFGFPNVEQVLFFTNAVDTRTRGLDVVALYDTKLGDGSTLSLEGAFNFNDTEVTDRRSSSPIFPPTALFDRVQETLVEQGQPRQHYILGGTWRRPSGLSANLRFNYFGKVAGEGFNPGVISEWGGKWLTDAAVTVPIRKDKVSLTVGALNLFDVYPDEWEDGPSGGLNQFGFLYGWETLPFGINGGYYYARVNLRLNR